MLPSHSLHLRPALTSLKIQPILLTPCCALSTTSKPTQQQRRFLKSPTRPSPSSTTLHTHKPSHHSLTRFESTTTTVTPLSQPQPQPPPSSPSSSTPAPPLHPLTWNAYLSLRKTRRRYNLASSVLSSVLTTAGGMSLLTSFNIEHVNFFGLDPFLMLGLVTLGSGAVGWLLGPFVGNAVFGMAHRRVGVQIAEVSGLSCTLCGGLGVYELCSLDLRFGGFFLRDEC